jgi:hypothetical protein
MEENYFTIILIKFKLKTKYYLTKLENHQTPFPWEEIRGKCLGDWSAPHHCKAVNWIGNRGDSKPMIADY